MTRWNHGRTTDGIARAEHEILLAGGRPSRCMPHLLATADAGYAARDWPRAASAYLLAAEVAACLGQTSTAARALGRTREIRLVRPGIPLTDRTDLVEALLAARQGRAEDSTVVLTLGRAMLSADRSERDRAELVHAVDLIVCGRWHDAFDVLAELVVHLDATSTALVTWGVLGHLADAARHTGQVGAARRLVSALGTHDGVFEGDIGMAELLYATAVLSDPDRADACYQAFLSHDPARWPWLTARARLAYGQHLRRTRHVRAARRHLAEAQRLFTAMEVPAWEQQAITELRAAGVRDGSAAPTTGTGSQLSAQELQIARLAASGLSNREIGQSLFLSPRTVGSHLYRIFPKLDVTSRVQLSDVLSHP